FYTVCRFFKVFFIESASKTRRYGYHIPLIFQHLFHRAGIQNPTISLGRCPKPDDFVFSVAKNPTTCLFGIQNPTISLFQQPKSDNMSIIPLSPPALSHA
ncbi:MAG: hypothetical protein RR279_05495, partial [Alistipes sp.]